MGFKSFVEQTAFDIFVKEYNLRQPLAQKAANSNTGLAQVTKLNSNGTVDVTINGQLITGVSPGSSPIGIGSTRQIVNGIQLI